MRRFTIAEHFILARAKNSFHFHAADIYVPIWKSITSYNTKTSNNKMQTKYQLHFHYYLLLRVSLKKKKNIKKSILSRVFVLTAIDNDYKLKTCFCVLFFTLALCNDNVISLKFYTEIDACTGRNVNYICIQFDSLVEDGIKFDGVLSLCAPIKYLPFTTIIISNYGLFTDNLRWFKPIDLTVLPWYWQDYSVCMRGVCFIIARHRFESSWERFNVPYFTWEAI